MNGQKALKQIALIKTGTTIEQIKPRHGDFEDWFAEGMGIRDLLQIDVFRHEPLPVAERLSGIVITGSPAMVSDREDWSEQTAKWLAGVVPTGLPVLGVCYGHQLLAHALGGRVAANPNGRQIGTVMSQLVDNNLEKDPLLGHLPATFAAQTSHSESVLELPDGAKKLAVSPLDQNFAVRFAENAWGVQFHPEFSVAVTADYIRCRAGALRKERLDPEALLQKTTDTREAKTVLRQFVELCQQA